LTLTIRKATEKDDAVLADLGRRTFEEAFGPQNDPEDMRTYLDASFSLAQIVHELTNPDTTFLLAYDSETLVGYAKLQEGLPPTGISQNKTVELSRLYVVSHQMGRRRHERDIKARSSI